MAICGSKNANELKNNGKKETALLKFGESVNVHKFTNGISKTHTKKSHNINESQSIPQKTDDELFNDHVDHFCQNYLDGGLLHSKKDNQIFDEIKASIKKTDSSTYKDENLQDSYFNERIIFRTKIAWPNVIFLLVINVLGFYGFFFSLFSMLYGNFFRFGYAVVLGIFAGQGVTIGAHRLWSHRTFKANTILRILLITAFTCSGQNSCFTWIRDHRQHHKYTDTDADPHNATRGLFFSHVGWLMMKKHPVCRAAQKTVYMGDIEKDPILMFQKRYFFILFFIVGFILPISYPILMGEDVWTSILINFFARYVIVLNVTWTVNSLAHFFGPKHYDLSIMARENFLVSYLTLGEGWHNYHHCFPWDYKAAEFGFKINVTKRLIEMFAKLGLAYDLRTASDDLIRKRTFRTGNKSYNVGDLSHYLECAT